MSYPHNNPKILYPSVGSAGAPMRFLQCEAGSAGSIGAGQTLDPTGRRFTGPSPLPTNRQSEQMNQEYELSGLNAQHKHIAQHEESVAQRVQTSEKFSRQELSASTTGNIQRREIPKALDLLSENVATLEKMLTELEQRLAPVLQAPHPEPQEKEPHKVYDIPMVNTLTHGVVSIKRMQDHVANIIGRLAL